MNWNFTSWIGCSLNYQPQPIEAIFMDLAKELNAFGHVLALRVFPENDFAPYRSIWHRTPDGTWSIYVDGPRVDTACPRYFGAAPGTWRFKRCSNLSIDVKQGAL